MKRLFLATAAVAFAAPAFAADPPPSNPSQPRAAVAVFDWSGFSVGAHAGYGWAETSGAIGPFGGITPTYGGDRNGWLYGANIGAQRQFGSWVLGLEASISKTEIAGSSAVGGLPPLPPGVGVSTSYDMAYLAIAEAKIGFAMNQWLPFVTAGGACAQGKAGIAVTTPGPSFAATSSDEYACGWTLGAGLDYALTSNIIASIKYNYLDLGTSTPCIGLVGGACIGGPLDVTAHVARAGLSAKF